MGGLVPTLMTSRDYDVIFVTSQSSQSSQSETRIRINHPCGIFKHTISQNIVLKNQLIWLRTLGEEAFGASALSQKFGENCQNFNHTCQPSRWLTNIRVALNLAATWASSLTVLYMIKTTQIRNTHNFYPQQDKDTCTNIQICKVTIKCTYYTISGIWRVQSSHSANNKQH